MSKKYRMPVDAEPDLNADIGTGSSPDFEVSETLPIVDSVKPIDEAPKSVVSSTEPIKEYLSLRVFVTIAGPKPDQMAGFVSHAKRIKLGPLTMDAWRAEFKKFQEKLVA